MECLRRKYIEVVLYNIKGEGVGQYLTLIRETSSSSPVQSLLRLIYPLSPQGI